MVIRYWVDLRRSLPDTKPLREANTKRVVSAALLHDERLFDRLRETSPVPSNFRIILYPRPRILVRHVEFIG